MPHIQHNISLRPFNTFQVDVRAANFCDVQTLEQVRALCSRLGEFSRCMVLGGGSNVLFCGDYEGLIIHNRITGRALVDQGDHCLYTLGAGENWHRAVVAATDQGLYGIENLALIPGTVGAAPIQNIGAYGTELKDVFVSLDAVDLHTGVLKTFSLQDCRFAYRDSVFKQEAAGRYCIVSVTLRLGKTGELKTAYGDIEAEIYRQGLDKSVMSPARMRDVIISLRQRKLPDPALLPNAGSFFKNPVVHRDQLDSLKSRFPDMVSYPVDDEHAKLACGWLIDALGWKGRSMNGAKVHDRQALVLINQGGGAPAVKALAERIRQDVLETYGITLEPEPVWVE